MDYWRSLALVTRLARPRTVGAMAHDVAWHAHHAHPIRRYNMRMLGRIGH